MKFSFWCSLCIFSFTIYSATTTCREELSYGYRPDYPYDKYPHRTCWMFHYPKQFTRYLASVTVTCSNISSDLELNYNQEYKYHPNDLIIQNSVIPKLPSNSSLLRIQQLRKLVLKNLQIEELSAGVFDGLDKLQTLDLSLNKLGKVPYGVFDNLSNLIDLDASNNLINQLERRSIAGLIGLKVLYLNGNNLTVLHDGVFNSSELLEFLDISDNPLEQFPKASFTHLKTLFARNTRLKKFDINLAQSRLVYVDVSASYLEAINFDNFPTLVKLNLSRNRIKAVQNWEKLSGQEVLLNHNNITEVAFPNMVIILDLSYNNIQHLTPTNNSINSINILNLAFNEISTIQEGVFWNLLYLEVLHLEHNSITMLNSSTFLNCSSLKTIDLSHNNIHSIAPLTFQHTDKLNFLNISHNHLTTVSAEMLDNPHQLSTLYVDNNDLVWFEARSFVNLKTLFMNDNSWSCEVLRDLLHHLKIGNVDVIDADSLDDDNVDGVSCVFDKKS